MEALRALFRSRKFVTALAVVLGDVLALTVGPWAGIPEDLCVQLATLITLIGAVVIGGVALEDYGLKRAGTTVVEIPAETKESIEKEDDA